MTYSHMTFFHSKIIGTDVSADYRFFDDMDDVPGFSEAIFPFMFPANDRKYRPFGECFRWGTFGAFSLFDMRRLVDIATIRLTALPEGREPIFLEEFRAVTYPSIFAASQEQWNAAPFAAAHDTDWNAGRSKIMCREFSILFIVPEPIKLVETLQIGALLSGHVPVEPGERTARLYHETSG